MGRAARSLAQRLTGLAGALVLTALCVTAAPGAGPALVLNLVETDTGRVALSVPVSPGEAFTVWFLHSYDRAFFAEHYRALAPGSILLTNMTFKSNLNGGGFEYHDFYLHPDGVGELRNINEPREEVHFMMGSPDMANHTLILRGERIRLVNYVSPGTLVSFRVCHAPRKERD
ncbi:MAG: DUF1850 domain-containing protein [Proteobacteria bacterium]|nr:DUF1850 domain-containing protein [Pseudomonadota bacterium]MBU1451392.1 DUF1850 domain-containing protein [Pseudomonadota bacterium]MBU2468022.1 DUF1850 domain-containing protein [Pseudomonadota bacterium]MBU2518328.1 DUF1850 domain-containing protein [Pseudomonadota bacterium]